MTLKGIDKKIDQIVKVTLSQYANLIFNEAMSKAPEGISNTFRLKFEDDGLKISIYSDNVLAAYYEFGTGEFARNYLSGKPTEMIEDAIQFFVNGRGTLPAQPYLYPTYYKYKDEVVATIDANIQKLFDRVKL